MRIQRNFHIVLVIDFNTGWFRKFSMRTFLFQHVENYDRVLYHCLESHLHVKSFHSRCSSIKIPGAHIRFRLVILHILMFADGWTWWHLFRTGNCRENLKFLSKFSIKKGRQIGILQTNSRQVQLIEIYKNKTVPYTVQTYTCGICSI